MDLTGMEMQLIERVASSKVALELPWNPRVGFPQRMWVPSVPGLLQTEDYAQQIFS
jgi:hypothetical protein